MPFNEMLDHQKSRCRSGKTNKIIDTTFERRQRTNTRCFFRLKQRTFKRPKKCGNKICYLMLYRHQNITVFLFQTQKKSRTAQTNVYSLRKCFYPADLKSSLSNFEYQCLTYPNYLTVIEYPHICKCTYYHFIILSS